jgi:hypothetical protein
MARHDTLVIKDTHRGLLYEDGVFRDVLAAGRYHIPRDPSRLATFFGVKGPRVEVVLVDIRSRDRTVVIQELLTADGATISATFAIQYRVADPVAAIHRVKNFEERLQAEAQTAARRVLRGLSVEEILSSRDEVGEEMLLQIRDAIGTAGVDVTALDFKDLVVPDELRKVMNQAVIARKLRLTGQAEAQTFEDEPLGVTDDRAVEDDDRMIIAGARFRHDDFAEPDVERFAVGDFDGAPFRRRS